MVTEWYRGVVAASIQKHGENVDVTGADILPELKLSIIKPEHAGYGQSH